MKNDHSIWIYFVKNFLVMSVSHWSHNITGASKKCIASVSTEEATNPIKLVSTKRVTLVVSTIIINWLHKGFWVSPMSLPLLSEQHVGASHWEVQHVVLHLFLRISINHRSGNMRNRGDIRQHSNGRDRCGISITDKESNHLYKNKQITCRQDR